MDDNLAQKYKKESMLSLKFSRTEEFELYKDWINDNNMIREFSYSLTGCENCNYHFEGKDGFCEICARFI